MKLVALLLLTAQLTITGAAHAVDPSTTAKPTAKDSISIFTISPAVDAPLQVRNKAEIVVLVNFKLSSAPSGDLALIVQEGDTSKRRPTPVLYAVKTVPAGAGSVEFRGKIRVPTTSSLQVFVALQPQDTSGTGTVDVRTYKVTP